MARTKDDFLDYAKRFSRAGSSSERSGVSSTQGNGSSVDSGNENTITNVFRTDESYDEPTPVSVSDSERIWGSDEGYSGVESGEDGRDTGSDSSSYGTANEPGWIDLPVRTVNPGTHQFDKPIQPGSSGVRAVTRTRKTLFDSMTDLGKKFAKEPKQKDKPIVKDSISGRKLLTIAEATASRSGLIQLLLWSSENLDHGITAITKGHQEVEIWSNLEYSDAEILVDAFSDAAQKSERITRAYRQVVEYHKKFKVGVILAPRIYRSIVYTITTGIDLRV